MRKARNPARSWTKPPIRMRWTPEGGRRGSGGKPSTKRLELQEVLGHPHGRSHGLPVSSPALCLPLCPPSWAMSVCGPRAPRLGVVSRPRDSLDLAGNGTWNICPSVRGRRSSHPQTCTVHVSPPPHQRCPLARGDDPQRVQGTFSPTLPTLRSSTHLPGPALLPAARGPWRPRRSSAGTGGRR